MIEVDNKISSTTTKPPKFTVRPQQNILVTRGTSAILKCQVDGYPPPSVQWSRRGHCLKHGPKYKISSVGDEHTLEVTSAAAEDTGQYVCILSNQVGNTSTTTLVTVEVTPRPTPSSSTSSVVAASAVSATEINYKSLLKNRAENASTDKTGSDSTISSSSSLISVHQTLKSNVEKSSASPLVEKNGSVNQVDFRGILRNKNKQLDETGSAAVSKQLVKDSDLHKAGVISENKTSQNKPSGDRDHKPVPRKLFHNSEFIIKSGSVESKPKNNIFGDSDRKSAFRKPVKDTDFVKPKSETNGIQKKDLSQKRQIFETNSSPIKPTFPNGKSSGRGVHGKLNQVLKKFENNDPSPVTDFRSVLKHRPNITNNGGHDSKKFSSSLPGKLQRPNPDLKLEIPSPKSLTSTTRWNSGSERNNARRNTSDVRKDSGVHESVNTVRSKLEQFQGRKMDVKESVGDRKPEIRKNLVDVTADYGTKVVLECKVDGAQDAGITWAVNDKAIKPSKFFQMSYIDSIARLLIAEAYSEDEGEYTCTATNERGSSKTTCHLRVQDQPGAKDVTEDSSNEEPFSPTATPPKIYNISPTEFCILRGGMIEFKASYTSVPAGTVTWCKNRHPILSDGRMRIDTSEHFSTLIITNIQPGDSGRFDITVENALGSDNSCASLTVQDVPEPPVGEPCVSDVTLTSVTLSWYGPAYDGGCPVTNYRVEMCDAEDQEWIPVTTTCINTSYHIDKLTPHTPYFFRVFAENKHGLSAPCVTSDVTVTTDRRPSTLSRLQSTESDDEIPFEHREVNVQPGRTFEDHYNCLQEVGKGKFGCVYKCEEKSTGKIWAAKVLKCREADKKKVQLEVEIMNQLKHPKILMLWDVFSGPRKMVLIMEFIAGGELFERVLDDDFELTERDCIQFMRQILDAIHYMHGKNILHLDLKPENILCIKNESNKIKIIDFGLARFYNPGESVRVLFGTPEFIAPEVVNYDEIGFTTDMWSVGVICYVLLTGLSPFMGDSDTETLANVTKGDFDFEDDSFDAVSDDGKDFIEKLLVKNKKKRMMTEQALGHQWLALDAARMKHRKINTRNLKRFMARRKWQKTGNAIRALGRMTSLQKLLKRDSAASSSASGDGSTSSCSSVASSGSQSTLAPSGFPDTIPETDNAKNVSGVLKVGDTVEITKDGVEETDGMTNGRISKESNNNKTHFNMNGDLNVKSNDDKMTKFNSAFASEKISCDLESKVKPANECADKDLQHRESSAKSKCPKLTKSMVDSKAFPGDAVRFDVAFEADTNTKVTWYFEDEIIRRGPRHSMLDNAVRTRSLVIKDVCEEDDGEYHCKVENEDGEALCSAELIVYGAI